MSPADSLAAGQTRRLGLPGPRPKRIRVFFVDADATDSDSSGGEDGERGGKRRVWEAIDIDVRAASASVPAAPVLVRRRLSRKAGGGDFRSRRFRGVRRRPWGRYSAEIRDPSLRKRMWLGTFDTAEEAAAVYDNAALRLKGSLAVTNFDSDDSAKRSSPLSKMKLRPRRETKVDNTNAATTTTAPTSVSPPAPVPASPQPPQPSDDVVAFNPFASLTSVLRYTGGDEAPAQAFDFLSGGLGELGELVAAAPPSMSAEFDWLPWWEGEDFVTAGLTASAVSVK